MAASRCALALLLAAAGPRAQADTALSRFGAARDEVEKLLRHDDARVRGEAALILGTTRDASYYPRLLAIARDSDPRARLRGIVSLGYLAAPGADSFLGDLLQHSGRDTPERAAAALALGLLPDWQSAPAIDAYFRQVDGSSYRRHRQTLSALLLGLQNEPHPSRHPALAAILQDRANREPVLRELALATLSSCAEDVRQADTMRMLGAADERERVAALRALTVAGIELDQAERDAVQHIAQRDRSPRARAAALRLLTAIRAPASLDLGVRALRSTDPAEVAAGVRAVTSLGGGTVRRAMEDQILSGRNSELQAAMLAAYDGTAAAPFAVGCLELAQAEHRPLDLRVHAAVVAARSGVTRAQLTVRQLFLDVESTADLATLARAMQPLDPELIPWERIHPPASPRDQRLFPARLGALLATGQPAAGKLMALALASPDVEDDTRVMLLRALRAAITPASDPTNLELLPEALRSFLL